MADVAPEAAEGPIEDEEVMAPPPVVAVIVTCDPGPWLEEALGSWAAQDYTNLAILVIDAGSATDPTSRVASVLPNAFVRRLPANAGYAAAANEVLGVVEGASHYVFAHDDVAPDPDAVRLLLEEAFRSNAAVVGPKLVRWNEPARLLQVGLSVDKGGVVATGVDRGELDQEQHDAVRDVFYVPGAMTLVRADLFATLGGYDEAMTLMGEDLDLCWRAQVAGARVLVVPAARARHLEALTRGLRIPAALLPAARRPASPAPEGGSSPEVEPEVAFTPGHARRLLRPLLLRHRHRAVLKNYGPFHLLRVLPQLVAVELAEIAYCVVSGRMANVRAIVGAWTWNVRHLEDLRAARAQLRRVRAFPDSEVRRLQVRGSARVSAFVRGQFGGPDRARLVVGRSLTGSLRANRSSIVVWSVIAAVLLVGSRALLGGSLPAVGELQPFPSGPSTFMSQFLAGWRTSGLGSDAPAPPAFPFLALTGTVLLGAMGVLHKLVVLGLVPLGLLGVHRLTRPLENRAARLVAVVVYASIPLPYDALARGRWSGLIAYAAMPWVMRPLVAATGAAPFADDEPPRRSWPAGISLGVGVAVVAAFVPAWGSVSLLAATGLAIGGFVVGERNRAPVWVALIAMAVGGVLLAPWSVDLLSPGDGLARTVGLPLAPSQGLTWGEAMRFDTGHLGGAPVGWAFVVAAALPLLIGSGWRLTWAARCWAVALACWVVAWVAGRGSDLPIPSRELVLAPAAVTIAVAAALGLVAFRQDLPGFRFGPRQLAGAAAAVAVAVGTLPVLLAAVDGRWELPPRDVHDLLSWMPDKRAEGAFRVVWLGAPDAIPGHGWKLTDGVAYAMSRNGPPGATDLWPASDGGPTGLVKDALDVVRRDGTTGLGHLLAPMAVRYVVVVHRSGAGGGVPVRSALPGALVAGLAAQTDLRLIGDDPATTVWENAAWAPARAQLDGPTIAASKRGGAATALTTDLSSATPVLPRERSSFRFEGPLDDQANVYQSEARSSRWRLDVAGRRARARAGFGWATAYEVGEGGPAVLHYVTPWTRYVAILVELGLWFWVLRALYRWRRGRAADAAAAT